MSSFDALDLCLNFFDFSIPQSAMVVMADTVDMEVTTIVLLPVIMTGPWVPAVIMMDTMVAVAMVDMVAMVDTVATALTAMLAITAAMEGKSSVLITSKPINSQIRFSHILIFIIVSSNKAATADTDLTLVDMAMDTVVTVVAGETTGGIINFLQHVVVGSYGSFPESF